VYELLDIGYKPAIEYKAGKISTILFSLNDTRFIVKTQQLAPDEVDGDIVVNTEEKFNKMNEALADFNKRIFKNNHKSFYTCQDIDILDNYRTIVPSGVLVACSSRDVDLSEIDISKAFTSAFSSIERIPIFNEFDTWKPCRGRSFKTYDINELSLYMVKSTKLNLFF